MSKYYKAEDVIRKRAEDLADTSYWEWGNPKNVDDWIEVAEMEFADLPTIEVMEYPQVDGITPTLVTPAVSEDCISRKWLEEHKEVISYKNEWYETEIDEFVSWENIENAPSVVPSRAEGEWIMHVDDLFPCESTQECSVCHSQHLICGNDDNYCPYCGAYMKG